MTMVVSIFGTPAGTLAFRFQALCAFQIFYASSKGLVSYTEISRKRPNDAENQGLMTGCFRLAFNSRDLPRFADNGRDKTTG
jgi:hypothetical protein